MRKCNKNEETRTHCLWPCGQKVRNCGYCLKWALGKRLKFQTCLNSKKSIGSIGNKYISFSIFSAMFGKGLEFFPKKKYSQNIFPTSCPLGNKWDAHWPYIMRSSSRFISIYRQSILFSSWINALAIIVYILSSFSSLSF